MAHRRYTPVQKMETVWQLREKSVADVSEESGITQATIRKWHKNYDQIHAEFYRYINDEAVYKLMTAQTQIANKIIVLIEAMSEQKIESAPLNQLSSALGVLVDRFLRIQNAKDIEEDIDNTFRVEYYDATTGKVSTAPPWTDDDSEDGEPLYNSFLWETLRQNRTRQADRHRDGSERYADLVARTHVSNGESSLARFEDDDEERDWYHD